MNDKVMISRLINSAGPTSTEALVITFQRVALSICSPVLMIPLFQPFMRVFNHHDGGIHHRPHGNGDPAQGHNIGVSPGNA